MMLHSRRSVVTTLISGTFPSKEASSSNSGVLWVRPWLPASMTETMRARSSSVSSALTPTITMISISSSGSTETNFILTLRYSAYIRSEAVPESLKESPVPSTMALRMSWEGGRWLSRLRTKRKFT